MHMILMSTIHGWFKILKSQETSKEGSTGVSGSDWDMEDLFLSQKVKNLGVCTSLEDTENVTPQILKIITPLSITPSMMES